MLRKTLTVLTLLALAGCSGEAGIGPFGSSDPSMEEATHLAAAAATAEYPKDLEASDDLKAAVIVHREKDTIEIINFSDRTINNANIWVNGDYYKHVDTISPGAALTIKHSELFNRNGTPMERVNMGVNKVELHMGDDLYTLQGPAYK